MKRTRKGFTLVELLIVIAVVAVLAVMMTMSSTDAVDSARANTIISSLNSLKAAAYQMYVHEPVGMMTIAFTGDDRVGIDTREEDSEDDERSTVADILARYLGKEADIITDGNYGVIGDKTNGWYAVYKIADTDSSGVKAKLKASAAKVELLGVKPADDEPTAAEFADLVSSATFYPNTAGANAETFVALKVR